MYDLHTETSADIYRGGSMWSPYYIYSKVKVYRILFSLSRVPPILSMVRLLLKVRKEGGGRLKNNCIVGEDNCPCSI
jgi:hypothetical protein